MGDMHTREEPNGSRANIEIPGRTAQSLKFGESVAILVNGRPRQAVVDVIVAAFWGGTNAALKHWKAHKTPHPHAMIKLVWEYETNSWNEARDVFPASQENFEAWINAFDGDKPPTPMP